MGWNDLGTRRALLALTSLLVLLAFSGLGCSKKSPTSPKYLGMSSLSPSLKQDVQAVMRIQDLNTPDLMSHRDVVGTGTGLTADGRLGILVLTRRTGVRGLPSSLGGVPVEERVVGDVRAYKHGGGGGGGGGTLQCGTSTGNDLECAAGTIGCVVLKGSSKYFLSNNHVFARENAASIGERIDAPGRYDGRPICSQTPKCGTLSDFKPISFSSNNTIDCAIAAVDPSRTSTCAEACGYTPSSTVAAAFVGQAVKKCGRTSGFTTGTVQAINVTVQVQYSSGVATFVNQIMTPPGFIRSGDSGSLMVESSTNNPVGLCFAGGSGGTFANPIGPVLSQFGATVCNQ